MKASKALMTSFIMVCLLVLTSLKSYQETSTFEGVFDGKEDYGYNFIGIDEYDEEYTMTFHNVEKSVLKTFDLSSESLIGSKFMVTFTTTIETEKDEDGFEYEIETYTITSMKALK